MSNPFTITFGKIPVQYISRSVVFNDILECFESETPFSQSFIITGVRGMGKTVTMTEVSDYFAKNSDWIVIDLNPSRDLLDSFAAKLNHTLHPGKVEISEVNPSAFGISLLSVRKKEDPLFDVEVLIDELMKTAAQKKKKVLITIDEVSNTSYMRPFAQTFQSLIRKNYPVFLLMTGLYKNVSELQNESSLTFLYRTRKINLETLNLHLIKESYKNTFDMDDETAKSMAKLTCGYPFAYQVFGYLFWNHPDSDIGNILPQYDEYLANYAYDKIWQECSGNEKRFLTAMAESEPKTKKVTDIAEKSGLSAKSVSVYRDKLIKKGLITAVKRGAVRYTLPRFGDYILNKMDYESLD